MAKADFDKRRRVGYFFPPLNALCQRPLTRCGCCSTRYGNGKVALTRQGCPRKSPSDSNAHSSRRHTPGQKALRLDQQLLTEHERSEAVRGKFATGAGSQVDNQRVLLVDDVMA